MIIETDMGLTGQYPTPTIVDTGVTVTVTHEEVTPGHITNPHATAHHAIETQVHLANDKTPHTEDPHHTEVFPGISVDPDLTHHTNTTTKHHQNHLTAPTGQPGKNKDKKYKQVTIDDPPCKYYGSDDQSSRSNEDLY